MAAYLFFGCSKDRTDDTRHAQDQHFISEVDATIFSAKGSASVDYQYSLSYDHVGRLNQEVMKEQFSDGTTKSTSFTFMQNGNDITISSTGSRTTYDGCVLTLDKVGLLLFNGESDIHCSYNSMGQLIKQEYVGAPDSYTIYQWEGKNVISSESFENGKWSEKRIFTYTSHPNNYSVSACRIPYEEPYIINWLTRIGEYANLPEKEVYSYSAGGTIKTEETLYLYEFDAENRVAKCTKMVNSRTSEIIEFRY